MKTMIASFVALLTLSPPVLAHNHLDYSSLGKELLRLVEDEGAFSEEDKRSRIYEIADAFDTRNKERFELFSDCHPINLIIEELTDDAKKIGLTKERVQNVAESRLRSARLYKEEDILHKEDGIAYVEAVLEEAKALVEGAYLNEVYLYVTVHVVGHGVSISLEFKKRVDDQHEHSGLAITWDARSAGTHGGDPGFIISGLSESMDKFLVEYLRVNESACEGRVQRGDPHVDGLSGPTHK